MQGEEVDLAQHRSSPDDAFAVDKEVIAENSDQSFSIGSLAPRRDGGI